MLATPLDLASAITGTQAPAEITETLELIWVNYLNEDDAIARGPIVVHQDLAEDVRFLFEATIAFEFPIARVALPSAYGWDDQRLMAANITSAFNFRDISGTEIPSNHSCGRSLDINPLYNPYQGRNGTEPRGAIYDPGRRGTLGGELWPGNDVVAMFKLYGWSWGGDWVETPDPMHFEKLA